MNVHKNDLLFLVISSFFVTIVWVALSVYRAAVTSTIDETLQVQIVPLPPTFDLTTVEKMKNRKMITPLNQIIATTSAQEVIEPVDNPQPSPTPETVEELELSTEGSPSPTPEISSEEVSP